MDPTNEQRQILCESREKCDGDPANDYTSLRGRKHEPYSVFERQSTKGKEQSEVKTKSMLIIFFDIKRIVHKEFVLTGQIVSSACYCYA
jgi:hypothetical protein